MDASRSRSTAPGGSGRRRAAGLTVVLLNYFSVNVGWRLAFALGAVLAIGILFIRHMVPESPRWLLTHGRADEAEEVVRQIEGQVRKTHPDLPEPGGEELEIEQRGSIGFVAIARHVMNGVPGTRRARVRGDGVAGGAVQRGTGVAIAAPWTFGKLIETGSVGYVTLAFVIGAAIMAIGGIVEILLGVDAEGKSLEAVARPLNAVRRAGEPAMPARAR